KVYSRKCSGRTDTPPQLAFNLQRLLRRLCKYQERFFVLEVADAPLEALVSNLNADHVASAEMWKFWGALHRAHELVAALARQLDPPKWDDHFEPIAAPVQPNQDARRLNRKLVAYEAILGRTRLQSMPLKHNIEANILCNLRCLTCHQSSHQDWLNLDLA